MLRDSTVARNIRHVAWHMSYGDAVPNYDDAVPTYDEVDAVRSYDYVEPKYGDTF